MKYLGYFLVICVLSWAIGLAVATVTQADVTVYKWVDGETIGYTNEEKRVPLKFRDEVEIIEVNGLEDYEKLTIIKGNENVGE